MSLKSNKPQLFSLLNQNSPGKPFSYMKITEQLKHTLKWKRTGYLLQPLKEIGKVIRDIKDT